jgi:hypothetical protein
MFWLPNIRKPRQLVDKRRDARCLENLIATIHGTSRSPLAYSCASGGYVGCAVLPRAGGAFPYQPIAQLHQAGATKDKHHATKDCPCGPGSKRRAADRHRGLGPAVSRSCGPPPSCAQLENLTAVLRFGRKCRDSARLSWSEVPIATVLGRSGRLVSVSGRLRVTQASPTGPRRCVLPRAPRGWSIPTRRMKVGKRAGLSSRRAAAQYQSGVL